MTKLKPCPFCGSTNIALIDDGVDLCAECTDCHCRGAWGPTAEKAIVAWNRRTITKEQIEDMDAESGDMLAAAYTDGFYRGEVSMFKKLLPFLEHSQNCKESFSPFCQCGLEEIIQKYEQRNQWEEV